MRARFFFRTRCHPIKLQDITLVGTGGALADPSFGLLDFVNCEDVLIEQCHFENASSYGMSLYGSNGTITLNRFKNVASAAVKSVDASGLSITDNFVDGCGNNGILVWRSDNGHDGTIVTGNHIKSIDWKSGGNGQNGNGINIFRSSDVIVANNVITDCSFSAIRANGTVNCQIMGNNCRNLSEVAIFFLSLSFQAQLSRKTSSMRQRKASLSPTGMMAVIWLYAPTISCATYGQEAQPTQTHRRLALA